jgi:hypothetical protein
MKMNQLKGASQSYLLFLFCLSQPFHQLQQLLTLIPVISLSFLLPIFHFPILGRVDWMGSVGEA